MAFRLGRCTITVGIINKAGEYLLWAEFKRTAYEKADGTCFIKIRNQPRVVTRWENGKYYLPIQADE